MSLGPMVELAALVEAVLRGVNDGITVQDRTGALVFANDAAAQFSGYESGAAMLAVSGAEVIARFEMFGEDGKPFPPAELPGRVLLSGGSPVDRLVRFRSKGSGADRWSRVHATDVRDARGELSYVVNLFRDITEERAATQRQVLLALASQELAKSLDYQETLKTVARLAVPAVADWCTVDMFSGEHVLQLAAAHVDPAKLAIVHEIHRRYSYTRDASLGANRIRGSGQVFWVREIPSGMLRLAAKDDAHHDLLQQLELRSYIGAPLKRGDEVVGALTFVMAESHRLFDEEDVRFATALAERASIAIENARLYGEAEEGRRAYAEANRLKDEFLAVLGHELRNPLAPISTALEVMSLRDSHAHVRERAIIARQVRHLSRLVDDLLDVSRITRGQVDLERTRVAVSEVVGHAIEMSSPLLEERYHRLEVSLDGSLHVMGDPSRLAQVVANLVMNAAKYTDPNGQITVRTAREGQSVLITVKDTGVGISPQMLPRIFELFVQERQTSDRSKGGLGLGLSIARNLAHAHGGTLSARSDGLGRGSVFEVRLPAADGDASQPATPARTSRGPVKASGTRVLLVDDNSDALEVMAEALKESGYEVACAKDGPKALEAAARSTPHVAVLDIGLPVMDGYELARRMKAAPGLDAVKLVALTGYGQSADRERAAEAGFHGHLVKPVSLDRVIAMIEQLVAA
jgi:signal transduction histidine kinase/CheY-like chemotaxis protein